MEDRIKFIVGQKKRLLNELTTKTANYKLEGKNLGVFLVIESDGHIRTPREFDDVALPTLSEEYEKLTKKEKNAYDKKYCQSATYLIKNYNEANKKYQDIFQELDVFGKIDLLKEEINNLQLEQKRANIYFSTLARQSDERKMAELGAKKKLTDEQIVEVNQEITQINYINQSLDAKTKLLEELKETL